MKRLNCCSLLLATMLLGGYATSARASTLWLSFPGWNHNTITTTGQTFLGVLPGIDVTVTGTPNSFLASTFTPQGIRTGVSAGSQQFTFAFTAPVDLVVDVQSLDRFESLTVTTGGPIGYTHSLGAIPSQANSITLLGNGVGLGIHGAARGLLALGSVSSFTWDYASDRTFKYERFRVGSQIVPEPSGLLPLGLILTGCFIQGRRWLR